MDKIRVLLIEDETDLGNVIKQYLEVMDFEVVLKTNGLDALNNFKENSNYYHILLIDVNLPGLDGFELASRVIEIDKQVALLFLTSRSEKSDKLHGLKIGADDYITKPFDIEELVLRIKNIVKRKASIFTPFLHETGKLIEVGDIKFQVDLMKLTVGNKSASTLTERESELLQYLFKNPNKIIKREEILIELWGENDYFLGRSLDVFISRLRKRIGNNDYVSITNIYGVGFIFNLENSKPKKV
jgi:DNA-binding response OmpR family regulator